MSAANALSKVPMPVWYGVAALGVVYGVYRMFFYDPVEEGHDKDREQAEKELKDRIAELEALAAENKPDPQTGKPVEKPTWDDFKYQEYADNIYSAHGFWNDNELLVSKQFEHILTDLDYMKLDAAFGMRDGEKMTAYIRGFLDQSEIAQINNMLAKNNVTYKI